ncbi:Alpha crystallin/Hsp20 domain [Dillenia turbinata]|uniref:Alpha crystallin/Hsp20 domain n=1 Tax=Dillenia turbinata TaxID=194707 RepID=A0AAN8VS45_9MAGN
MEMDDLSGTPEQQAAFLQELESFFNERGKHFKRPKFYGKPLNCLKLWRAVIELGGYDEVTAGKLWLQIGSSFNPPKTCTTVSFSFRGFYEKALLDYERHVMACAELQVKPARCSGPVAVKPQTSKHQGPESDGAQTEGTVREGRVQRVSALRAMQGWHAMHQLDEEKITGPVVKEKNFDMLKRQKKLKDVDLPKRKTASSMEHAVKSSEDEESKRSRLLLSVGPFSLPVNVTSSEIHLAGLNWLEPSRLTTSLATFGPPADWVKINVVEAADCFEVYALVPGFLREEINILSDPVGRIVITGEPEQVDSPWEIGPFQKVVSLPAKIDPIRTTAVLMLHGRLHIHAPFERSSSHCGRRNWQLWVAH